MLQVRPGIDPLLRRPFSICGRDRNRILILYQVVGRGTAILMSAKQGERVSVLGPLGKGFEIPAKGNTPILVGGGIGVAPLFFIAQSLKRRNVEFMMGFASASEILPLGRLKGPRIKISLATDDGTRGHAGFVTDLLERRIEKRAPDKGGINLFVCGPRPMLKKVARLALAHRIPCHVSLEARMACGLGACLGCAVKASFSEGRAYYHVCKDGPVFPVEAIDWEAL
jgi:dihydroorotate dehydrogenase electron transfer subunit